MKRRPSPRFWIELTLGTASAMMLAATLIKPDWIEHISGMTPDGGDGSTEWGGTVALAGATLIFLADAGRLWRWTARAT